jgi:indole-3-glycerol phosphate synthase
MTFLERMAAGSRERVRVARAAESEAKLEQRALAQPAPPPLTLNRFDVIAELTSYARGGAAAVSVLTEPSEFKGTLAHLADAVEVLRAARRPVMRKDFLTDPYQVLEARAAGAGGVLVILAMLDDGAVRELVDCAQRCGMFVLLEAFDRADLERLAAFDRAHSGGPPLLAGVNCRDLRDLEVRFDRFAELAPHLPRHLPTVAESGIATAANIETVARAGYRLALVGSSLMKAAAPDRALEQWLGAGRAAAAERQASCS